MLAFVTSSPQRCVDGEVRAWGWEDVEQSTYFSQLFGAKSTRISMVISPSEVSSRTLMAERSNTGLVRAKGACW
jgi:hypothetical protein